MIIGICGGSGSGKTTILNRLYSQFKELSPSVFTMDNYYRSIEEQMLDDNGEINFDLPTALDKEKLTGDLKRLAKGAQIVVKEYHFNSPPDKHVLITIEPSKLLIVEGLFLFHYPEVRKMLDFSIFIDVDQEVQLDRRLYRDQETRGYTREAILYQWENHVTPCFNNYLLPYRKDADFHFRNDTRADEDFQSLTREIEHRMEEQKTW
jgi:uridine kinase